MPEEDDVLDKYTIDLDAPDLPGLGSDLAMPSSLLRAGADLSSNNLPDMLAALIEDKDDEIDNPYRTVVPNLEFNKDELSILRRIAFRFVSNIP